MAFAAAQGLEQTDDVSAQLYNLVDDLAEAKNVINENPKTVAELIEVLSNAPQQHDEWECSGTIMFSYYPGWLAQRDR